MQELNFKLTIEETNAILAALGQQPYTQVFNLIQKIHIQAQQQLQQNGSAGSLVSPVQS